MANPLEVKRGAPLAGDEELVNVRFTGGIEPVSGGELRTIRISAGYAFECSAAEVGAAGQVTRAEWQQFLEPTGYFEEVR